MHRYLGKMKKYIYLLASLLFFLSGAVVEAAPQPIWLELNQAYLYEAGSSPITRVSVANPDIADVLVLDNTTLNIIGKAPGSTSLSIWSENEMRQDFVISVSNVDTTTGYFIQQSIGMPGVQVVKVGEKLVLQGTVENQHKLDQALGIAGLYAEKDNIVNLLQMKNPIMVNLSALVIDISGKDASDLGFKYGVAKEISSDGGVTNITFGTAGNFYGGMDWQDYTHHPFQNVDFMIQALASKNKLKVLSRPNITTMSGEEAEILIGGELPIPTTTDGEISIEWKSYGINLKIKPQVDGENKITSKIEAEVSGIDASVAIPTTAGKIPGLVSRKASTVLSVPDGQTMAIGGLMNSDESKVVSKVPLLGDIPVIGEFFKHTSKSKDKRELMILITPTIVTNNDPVKGSSKMLEEVENSKRQWQEMENIYPNDPPAPVSNEPLGPLYKKRDTSQAPSWTAKAEAELRQAAEQAERGAVDG